MRFIKLSKKRYLYLLDLIKEFKKKKMWEYFKSKDLFFIDINKQEFLINFISNENNIPVGITIFNGNEGLNTAHDIFSGNQEKLLSIADYAVSNVLFVIKSNLNIDEQEYLNKNDIKIKSKNNVIVKTYSPGFTSRMATNKEADIVIRALEIIIFLYENDLDIINEGFKDGLAACVSVNMRKKIYSLNMNPLPFLERQYLYTPVDEEERNEFKKCDFTDKESYLLTKNILLPVIIPDVNIPVLPLFCIYADDEKGLVDSELIISNPSFYRSYMINILKDKFEEFGIPKKIYFNNRKIYYELYSLLNSLGIEVILRFDNFDLDDFMYNVSNAVAKFFDIGINEGKDVGIDPKTCRDIFGFVKKIINTQDQYYEVEENETLFFQIFNNIFNEEDEDEEEYLNVMEEKELFS